MIGSKYIRHSHSLSTHSKGLYLVVAIKIITMWSLESQSVVPFAEPINFSLDYKCMKHWRKQENKCLPACACAIKVGKIHGLKVDLYCERSISNWKTERRFVWVSHQSWKLILHFLRNVQIFFIFGSQLIFFLLRHFFFQVFFSLKFCHLDFGVPNWV